MSRLDTIKMIGDVITQIDVMRGSLLPDDPQRHDLDDQRILLDDKQKRLSRAMIESFTNAATTLLSAVAPFA
jgi:hypothetical protein